MSDNQRINNQNYFVPGFLNLKKNQYLITVGFMIFFAFIGFAFGSIYKFQYEAESVLITNIEIVADANITEIMVDSQLELVRQLMYHPDITDTVILVEKNAGNPITLDQLKKKSVIERRLNSTIIKVRDYDPQIAARIANSWAEAAFDKLSEAYEHALLVSEAKWLLTSIEDCLSDETLFETGFCDSLSPEIVEVYTKNAQEIILKESGYSLGLTKEIQISQFQPCSVPSEPIPGIKANIVLSGALVGLILSMIFYELPFFKNINEAK